MKLSSEIFNERLKILLVTAKVRLRFVYWFGEVTLFFLFILY